MRARFLLNAQGEWKGVPLTPFCTFDVPEHLRDVVARNSNFKVLAKRGRPRKVKDGNAD